MEKYDLPLQLTPLQLFDARRRLVVNIVQRLTPIRLLVCLLK